MTDHATLQSEFLYEADIPKKYSIKGPDSEGCSLYRYVTSFEVINKQSGQVALENMDRFKPAFVRGKLVFLWRLTSVIFVTELILEHV